MLILAYIFGMVWSVTIWFDWHKVVRHMPSELIFQMFETSIVCCWLQLIVMRLYKTETQFVVFILGSLSNVSLPDISYTRPFIQGFWDGTDWILDNGTPLVYTNWETGEPQNTDTNRYIRLRKEKWRTSIDLNIRPVFCSYKP